jgi:hypothetical protein
MRARPPQGGSIGVQQLKERCVRLPAGVTESIRTQADACHPDLGGEGQPRGRPLKYGRSQGEQNRWQLTVRPSICRVRSYLEKAKIGYQSVVIKHLTIPFLGILFIGIISLSLFTRNGPAPSISGMTYDSSYKSATPLVSLDGSYSYQPSVMQDVDVGWKIWFCGGTDRGDDPASYATNYGDSIYYSIINIDSEGYYRSPELVLRHTNNDADEDGRGACAPSVIRHSNALLRGGEDLYLLYYECARRFYDRANKMTPFEGFTQICLAVSPDGINWQRYNEKNRGSSATIDGPATPVLSVNSQVLTNCGYKLQDGKFTLDSSTRGTDPTTGQLTLTCAGRYWINDYGVGHPSAVTPDQMIWLYYYNSMGNWRDHGVYLAKSQDGLHFQLGQKTNLPNDATIRYFNGSAECLKNIFVAVLVIGASNYLYYSEDGINFSPERGIDLGVVAQGHCAAPGTPGIVSNPSGNLTSLDINIISAEGYLGTGDNGVQFGCYSSDEDHVGRGSTWRMYLMRGSLSLLGLSSSIPTRRGLEKRPGC